jgi:hypothetical protein
MSSTLAQEDAPVPRLYLSPKPSFSQKYLNSRSRPQGKIFGVKRKEERKNSEPTPDNSKKSKSNPGKTKTASTSLKKFSTTPNRPSPYGLHLKIYLLAWYLSTLQTGQGNSRQNSTWSSDNLHKPKLTYKQLYYREQTLSKHLNNCKKTPTVPPNQPTSMGWKTSASLSQLRPSGANIVPTSGEYPKMENSYNTEESSLPNSVNLLSLLA